MFTSIPMSPAASYVPQTAYIQSINVSVNNDATFDDYNDLFTKLSLKYKRNISKKDILDFFGDCEYFGSEENKKLNDYIDKNRVKDKESIFDFYD